jgi:hypothetical protein
MLERDFALHEIKFDQRNIANPPVERRSSMHPTQSASAKPLISMKDDLAICSPTSMVPFTYQRIRLAAVKCNVVGACKNWQTLLTENERFGRVNVRYCRPLTKLL